MVIQTQTYYRFILTKQIKCLKKCFSKKAANVKQKQESKTQCGLQVQQLPTQRKEKELKGKENYQCLKIV